MVLILCKIAQLHIVNHVCMQVIHVVYWITASWLKWKQVIIWSFWSINWYVFRLKFITFIKIPFDYVISVVVFLMNTSNNSSLAGCCSVEDIKNVVENAIIPCPDNSWCTATCYRDFIFPTCAKKCHIVLRMGYWHPSYYHACVRCFIISVNKSYLL